MSRIRPRVCPVHKSESVRDIRAIQSANDSGLDKGACPAVKNIGKPCAGILNKAKAAKSHARFDEGGMVEAVMVRIVRYRRTKGAETDRSNLKPHIPSLYSTPSTLRKLLTIILNVCKS